VARLWKWINPEDGASAETLIADTPERKKEVITLDVDETPENANWMHLPPQRKSRLREALVRQILQDKEKPMKSTAEHDHHDHSTHRDPFGQLQTESRLSNGSRLSLAKGDLTQVPVDAIVNAANAALEMGGGLAGAILDKGGRSIQDECYQWIKANGKASPQRRGVTKAGNLPAHWIIHAVAPIWIDGKSREPHDLLDAYASSLEAASNLNLGSVAFPSLGTGIFRNPKELGARSAKAAVEAWAKKNPNSSLKEIRFVIWDQPTIDAFLQVFNAASGSVFP
jgi:O-acetyl-ADP-ribose deacetylase